MGILYYISVVGNNTRPVNMRKYFFVLSSSFTLLMGKVFAMCQLPNRIWGLLVKVQIGTDVNLTRDCSINLTIQMSVSQLLSILRQCLVYSYWYCQNMNGIIIPNGLLLQEANRSQTGIYIQMLIHSQHKLLKTDIK